MKVLIYLFWMYLLIIYLILFSLEFKAIQLTRDLNFFGPEKIKSANS